MLDTDETITVTTAFKRARIPTTANLRATRLGLVAIVDVYIARQRAVENHIVSGRRRHQDHHESRRISWTSIGRDRKTLYVEANSEVGHLSDTTDREWVAVAVLLTCKTTERNSWTRKHNRRTILNAVLYRTVNCCAWTDLPPEYPPPSTAWTYYSEWKRAGVWDAICTNLTECGYLARLDRDAWTT